MKLDAIDREIIRDVVSWRLAQIDPIARRGLRRRLLLKVAREYVALWAYADTFNFGMMRP